MLAKALTRCRPAVAALVVLVAMGLSGGIAAADVGYLYDPLGRLVAVIDGATDEVAIYRYDAVGNLLAIERQSASTVAVVEFRPHRGPVGTPVTLEGTGFSATPASNSVTFNGVAAGVSAATPTRLEVTVPAGATTGPIGVTAPGGAASSSVPFTVTATTGAPTITSFTPAVGTAGTAVTISGTEFEPLATHNKVSFYGAPRVNATVDAATATSLGVTVPVGARSGPLQVATPAGTAVSGADFFVPPGSYTPAAVAFTGRIVIGGASVAVALPASNRVGLVLFDGVGGQRLDLGRVSGLPATVTVYRPDGAVHATAYNVQAQYLPPLPRAGTYTIAVESGFATTVTLTLSAEVETAATVGGAGVSVSLPRAGQRGRVSFAGAAGQRVSAGITSATFAGTASVRTAEDTSLAALGGSPPAWAVDSPALPGAGSYAVVVEPTAAGTGSFTLTLSEEVTGTIEIGGAALALAITRPGQRARVTFAGPAGPRLNLGLTSVTVSGMAAISNPDGSPLVAPASYATPAAAVDTAPLPATGPYQIVIDPHNANTGTATLTLSEEIAGPITPGGAAVPVSLTRAGQRAQLSFSGTAGQRVSLALAGTTIGGVAAILNPAGAALQWGLIPGATFLDTVTLPAAGTHGVLVDPSAANTGSTTLTLYDVPPDVSGSLTINGAAVAVTTTVPGQNAALTFTGTSGQGLTIVGTGSTYGCVLITLIRPAGSNAVWQPCTASFTLATPATSTGTHTVKIDPIGASRGGVTVGVTSP